MEKHDQTKRTRHFSMAAMLFALGTLVLFIGGTFALYTNRGFIKGVVSTSRETVYFSSDALLQYKNDSEANAASSKVLTVGFNENAAPYTKNFKIVNYPSGMTSRFAKTDIVYRIDYEIEGTQGQQVSIFCNGAPLENGSEHKLSAGRASEDLYTITFPPETIGKCSVNVTVRPVRGVSGMLLYRQIQPAYNVKLEEVSFGAKGSFTDTGDSSQYHAINYMIEVQGGEGTATLTWDSAYLTIDPAFIAQVNPSEKSEGRLVFSVDSNIRNYPVVFYRTGAYPESESWDSFEVDLTAVKSEVSSNNGT